MSNDVSYIYIYRISEDISNINFLNDAQRLMLYANLTNNQTELAPPTYHEYINLNRNSYQHIVIRDDTSLNHKKFLHDAKTLISYANSMDISNYSFSAPPLFTPQPTGYKFTLGDGSHNIIEYDGNTGLLSILRLDFSNTQLRFSLNSTHNNSFITSIFNDISSHNYIMKDPSACCSKFGLIYDLSIIHINNSIVGNKIEFATGPGPQGRLVSSDISHLIQIYNTNHRYWKPSKQDLSHCRFNDASNGIYFCGHRIYDRSTDFQITFRNISQ